MEYILENINFDLFKFGNFTKKIRSLLVLVFPFNNYIAENNHQAFLQQKTCFVSFTGFNLIESAFNKVFD